MDCMITSASLGLINCGNIACEGKSLMKALDLGLTSGAESSLWITSTLTSGSPSSLCLCSSLVYCKLERSATFLGLQELKACTGSHERLQDEVLFERASSTHSSNNKHPSSKYAQSFSVFFFPQVPRQKRKYCAP